MVFLDNEMGWSKNVRGYGKDLWSQVSVSFWRFWIAIVLVAVGAYVISLAMQLDVKRFMELVDGIGSGATVESTYWEGTVRLFENNWTVCLQIILLAFLPIRYLFTVMIFVTSGMVGVVVYIAQEVGLNLMETIVLGLLPHTILELSTFIVTACFAGFINRSIIGKVTNLFRRVKKPVVPFRKSAKDTVMVFITVITPFIFVAAVAEGYVSRFLFS